MKYFYITTFLFIILSVSNCSSKNFTYNDILKGKSSHRVKAMNYFALKKDNQSLKYIIKSLQDNEEYIRLHAIANLIHFIKNDKIVNPLIEVLKNDYSNIVRKQALELLMNKKGNHKVKCIKIALSSNIKDIEMEAISQLGLISKDEIDLFNLLHKYIQKNSKRLFINHYFNVYYSSIILELGIKFQNKNSVDILIYLLQDNRKYGGEMDTSKMKSINKEARKILIKFLNVDKGLNYNNWLSWWLKNRDNFDFKLRRIK